MLAAAKLPGFERNREEFHEIKWDFEDDGIAQIEFQGFFKTMAIDFFRKSDEELLKVFAMCEDDKTGKVTFMKVKRVAKELGERLAEDGFQKNI